MTAFYEGVIVGVILGVGLALFVVVIVMAERGRKRQERRDEYTFDAHGLPRVQHLLPVPKCRPPAPPSTSHSRALRVQPPRPRPRSPEDVQ